jgi:hypothetical protein
VKSERPNLCEFGLSRSLGFSIFSFGTFAMVIPERKFVQVQRKIGYSPLTEGQPTESSHLGSPAEKIFREDELGDARGLPRLPVNFLIADHRRGIQIDAV